MSVPTEPFEQDRTERWVSFALSLSFDHHQRETNRLVVWETKGVLDAT
jgi:hypothetical protein